jgi:CRISPR-associated protein Cst2
MAEETKKDKVNCINIAYIFKTSLGSINGSWTEGNVSTVKKITLPDGRLLPYVSGQSLKYQIRKAWVDMGLKEQLSEVKQSEVAAGVNFTAGDPATYLDDDLLGFMIASSGENRRRTAPVRTSAAIGLFPYRGDRDWGTKSKEQTGGDVSAGGNIFETEVYYNYFKVNILIEVDRIGSFLPSELHTDKKKNAQNHSVVLEKRKERVENLFKALSQIWGGGKQSRIMTDMSPKFLAITFQTAKSPIFLESLNVSENEELDTKTIKEVLDDNSTIIKNKFLGVRSGIFKNDVLIEGETLVSIQTAFDNAIKHLKLLDF